jgi:hypothetical protein
MGWAFFHERGTHVGGGRFLMSGVPLKGGRFLMSGAPRKWVGLFP